MRDAGIVAILEPAFWVGQPRTHVGTYDDYLKTIIGWERFRASQFGIHHYCTVAINPKEAGNVELADGVMKLLPSYIHKDGVIGIGEIGLDEINPIEEKYFSLQLELAKKHNLPVLIHTPHRDKKGGTERSIEIVKDSGIAEDLVIIDHNNEETLPSVLEKTNCWAGHSIYPKTKMSTDRMVSLIKKYGTERILVNSAADWGISDPLNVPKTAAAMKEAGFDEKTIQTIFWDNPMAWFKKSPNFDVTELEETREVDQTELFEGNSVLRGQSPTVKR